jgi:hypothetical protein
VPNPRHRRRRSACAQWIVQQASGTDPGKAGFSLGLGLALLLLGLALVKGTVALPSRDR